MKSGLAWLKHFVTQVLLCVAGHHVPFNLLCLLTLYILTFMG